MTQIQDTTAWSEKKWHKITKGFRITKRYMKMQNHLLKEYKYKSSITFKNWYIFKWPYFSKPLKWICRSCKLVRVSIGNWQRWWNDWIELTRQWTYPQDEIVLKLHSTYLEGIKTYDWIKLMSSSSPYELAASLVLILWSKFPLQSNCCSKSTVILD